MGTNKEVKNQAYYDQEAKDKFKTHFFALMSCMDDYKLANDALDANNRKYGYHNEYGTDSYVQYQDRHEDWKAVDRLINNVYDANGDTYSESESMVARAFSQLTHRQKLELVKMVEGFFTGPKVVATNTPIY